MNTPAHLIIGMAAFGRPDARAVTAAALIGAFVPDLSLYALSLWHLQVLGTAPEHVFGVLYFSEGWQRIFRVDNSIPLWALGLVLAIMLRAPVAVAFCAAGLLHLVLDFPLHNDDARAHFWPITNWKFISPVSYWDPDHFGRITGPAEILLCVGLCLWLWRRFTGWVMRALILLLGLLQVLPAIMFALMFSG